MPPDDSRLPKSSEGNRGREWVFTGLPLSGLPSYKFGFRSFVQKNGPRGKEDTRVWYQETMFSQMVSYDFPLHGPLHEYFLYLVSAPPPPPHPRNPEGVVNLQKAICVVRSDSIIGVTLSVLLLFELKSVDDVGAGKLREMLTLHTNQHAVHGRFTLKGDCERQVRLERWNRFVNSKRELSIDVVHEQLISTIYEQSISPVDDTMAEDLIVSCRSQ